MPSDDGVANSTQAVIILERIGADKISAVQGAKEIKKVSNITHDETVGSISILTRADMFPANGSKGVYSLPSMIVYPKNPASEPMTITHRTVKVKPAKSKVIMAIPAIKSIVSALNNGMQTTVEYDPSSTQFVLETEAKVANIGKAGLEKFFRNYISKVAELNRYLEKANR